MQETDFGRFIFFLGFVGIKEGAAILGLGKRFVTGERIGVGRHIEEHALNDLARIVFGIDLIVWTN